MEALSGIKFTEPVRDPLWKNILLPASFIPVVESAPFVQLSRVLQLGPAHLVYPGATHTRRAHSLGVYEMARRIITAIYSREGVLFPGKSGIKAFLMAALCHDLGHFPYTHSLKELPLLEHEVLTGRIIRGQLSGILEDAEIDPEFTAAIVDETMPSPGPEVDFYRSLLSGVLDPDKLDYLNRDAWACGVPYGLQDVDFVLQHIGTENLKPGIDEKGVMAVEGVLFSKYRMYKAVYWHKAVRAATAMIKKALSTALMSGDLKPQDLYDLDDHSFYSLMQGKNRDRDGLVESVFRGRLARTCLEIDYDSMNAYCQRAASLEGRMAMEAELGDLLENARGEPAVVIIDLPEEVSFEADLPILGSGKSFTEWTSVFSKDLVQAFVRNLRVMRVFTDQDPIKARAIVSEYFGLY